MNSVEHDLRTAKQHSRLVNVYRVDDEIFYTGYVDYLAGQEVVLRTFDYLGMPDGMSLLKLKYISEVELRSEDLDLMRERMQLAQKLNLVSVTGNNLVRLTQSKNWIKEILGRSYVEQQAVMLILFDEGHHFKNLEGFVEHMGDDNFKFTVVNKNHFDQRHLELFSYAEVGIVEFLGKDLSQITRERTLLLDADHLDNQPATLAPEVDKILRWSMETNQLVEIASNLTSRYFYVGTVKAVNDQQYVLKLVDMNGQFGGYSILRRDSVKNIWAHSDYLTFMRRCIQNNLQADTYRQPVLNDEREFDASTNMMLEILEQDVAMKRFVRLQLLGESKTMVGVVNKIEGQTVIFDCFDDLVFQMLPGIRIDLSQIGEVAFDYLDVLLSQRQYIDKK